MRATFRIYCPVVRAELAQLVREHEEFVHPEDADERMGYINPIQYFDWTQGSPESGILHVSGHRCALTSEGLRVMLALKAAEEAGKASLLVYETSKPEMHWHETYADYLMRAPLHVRIKAYEAGETYGPWANLFYDLAPVAGHTPAQIWAAHTAEEARTIMRALALR